MKLVLFLLRLPSVVQIPLELFCIYGTDSVAGDFFLDVPVLPLVIGFSCEPLLRRSSLHSVHTPAVEGYCLRFATLLGGRVFGIGSSIPCLPSLCLPLHRLVCLCLGAETVLFAGYFRLYFLFLRSINKLKLCFLCIYNMFLQLLTEETLPILMDLVKLFLLLGL